MDFEKLVAFLRDNWPTIVATGVIVTPVLFAILKYLFKDRLDTLERRNKALSEECKQLQEETDRLQKASKELPFDAVYETCSRDISPPNLLFLALAEHWTFPTTHGEQVALLNPAWSNRGEWDQRSRFMENLKLLDRNNNEVVRSRLGTAIVYLALKDSRFIEVAKIVRSNEDIAKKWGIG